MSDILYRRQCEWAGILGSEHRLHDLVFRREALEMASSIMRLVRRNVITLLDRLDATGYRFACPGEAYVPPHDNPRELLDALEEEEIFVPIAMQAWIEIVGGVNLMGSHPEWPSSGYHERSGQGVWTTDPLVVSVNPEWLTNEREEWSQRKETWAYDPGPFCFGIAPDDIHKANLSGGMPYEMLADRLRADAIVVNERHGLPFVAYLRLCFEWGGFPGFELIENRPQEFIDQMRADLQRF